MTEVHLAHVSADYQTAEHGSLIYHPTRFDDRAGSVGLFFLHFYPLLLTVAGLLLFAALQLRKRGS